MLRTTQRLGQHISKHVLGGTILNTNLTTLNLLTTKMVLDVNVLAAPRLVGYSDAESCCELGTIQARFGRVSLVGECFSLVRLLGGSRRYRVFRRFPPPLVG